MLHSVPEKKSVAAMRPLLQGPMAMVAPSDGPPSMLRTRPATFLEQVVRPLMERHVPHRCPVVIWEHVLNDAHVPLLLPLRLQVPLERPLPPLPEDSAQQPLQANNVAMEVQAMQSLGSYLD